MNALIYGASGSGKTVNTTAVKGKRNLLICTDNSSIVLGSFDRPNLDIVDVNTAEDFIKEYRKGYESKKYDNIILDNLSDLFDMWILELDESKQYKDMRQAYQLVYQSLKRLTRESAHCGVNTIFTAWSDQMDITLPTGERVQRLQPKIQAKILDNVCGLMNIVGYVTHAPKDGVDTWYYVTEPRPTVMAKDQIKSRKFIMPQELWG